VDPYSRGKIAEEKVFKALEELANEGLIENFGQTFPFSNDDLWGIDFIILSNKRGIIPLQVKSSYSKKEQKKYLRRGIRYIVVWPNQGKEKIKKNLLKILENKL
jgi:hypothetical protein